MGLNLAFTLGFTAPDQPIGKPPLVVLALVVLALVEGVGLTYLWTCALWESMAVVAELYHLFNWHESKARRAAWSIGIGAVLLVLMVGLLAWLLMRTAYAAAMPGGGVQIALLTTALIMLPLLAYAMLAGFLEGRDKPVGHWIAARITQHKREQYQHGDGTGSSGPEIGNAKEGQEGSSADETPSTTPDTHAPSEKEREAWVAIRRYEALYRQYHHLKDEMEQELALYRERIEQLKAEMCPLSSALPSHSRNRITLAYRQWKQMYHSYLRHLADALRECQGGEELAAIVREQMEIRDGQLL